MDEKREAANEQEDRPPSVGGDPAQEPASKEEGRKFVKPDPEEVQEAEENNDKENEETSA